MLKNLNWKGTVDITQQEIANRLKIKKQQVQRSVSTIIKENLFTKERKFGRNIYQVNEDLAWKGWIDTKPSMHELASKLLN